MNRFQAIGKRRLGDLRNTVKSMCFSYQNKQNYRKHQEKNFNKKFMA